jgi:hypothetical protein
MAVLPNEVLPGPPEALLVHSSKKKCSIMNIQDIMNIRHDKKWRFGVVRQVRQEIVNYYNHPYFENVASIASIPVFDGHILFGVLNIESSAPNIFGTDTEMAETVVESLQPLVALLSAYR